MVAMVGPNGGDGCSGSGGVGGLPGGGGGGSVVLVVTMVVVAVPCLQVGPSRGDDPLNGGDGLGSGSAAMVGIMVVRSTSIYVL